MITQQYCYTVKTLNYCEQAALSQGIPNTLSFAYAPIGCTVSSFSGYQSGRVHAFNQSDNTVQVSRGTDNYEIPRPLAMFSALCTGTLRGLFEFYYNFINN